MQISAKLEGLIVAFLFLAFGLGLGTTVVTQVQGAIWTAVSGPTASRWNFTGYTGVLAIIPLMPLIYYSAVILGFMGIIWIAITRD